jgi:CHAT domain-containing protein/tetratricopeptide (TPR) repeat protein
VNVTRVTRAGRLVLLFSISILASATATEPAREDKARTAAEQAMSEARTLRTEGGPDSSRKAAERFAEAASLWRELGDSKSEAGALESAGTLLERMDPHRALSIFQPALAVRRSLRDPAGEASVLTHIGVAQQYLGEPSKARDNHIAALALARPSGDKSLEAQILHNLGGSYWALGEHAKALQRYDEALALWRQLGDHEHEARTINGIGIVHQSLGELQEALDAFRQALPLLRASGNRIAEGATLHNLGLAYFTAGDIGRALEEYERALVARRAAGDRRGEAMTLYSIAAVHDTQGNSAAALDDYRRALGIQREAEDLSGQALTLESIGRVQVSRKEMAQALSTFDEGLRLAHQADDPRAEGATAWGRGLAYAAQAKNDQALASLEQAERIFRALGNQPLEIGVMHDLAKVRLERGEVDEARAEIERAIDMMEQVRSRVVSNELRSAYGASNRSFYELEIEVLMREHARQPKDGLDALAFATSEKARARALLDTLAEAHAHITEGVDPAVLELENDLWRRLTRAERQRIDLLARKETGDSLAATEQEVQALLGEYHDAEERLRASSPQYASLTSPEPLSLRTIQDQVLDPDSLLLEYTLGEERSFVWAVTQDSLWSYELPKRSVIEAAARRFYQLLARSRNRTFRGQAALAAAELSRMILGPVSRHLGQRRLLVIADGALNYVPFAALPDPSGVNPATPTLLAGHEIVYLPSASSVALIRRDRVGRPVAAKTIAVFSDPVFRADDPRVRRPRAAGESSPGRSLEAVARSAAESGLGTPGRLRFSRREAEAIVALVPAGTSFDAHDFAANRAAALSPSLGDYRIVHFATHGLLNSLHPDLSGIILSLVGEDGHSEDGFLRLHDVYNLKLNADLVVLSACQTALGQEVSGEGLVGLTRGFFYAGAPRVVASLWSVGDQATAVLMARFYRALLKDGLDPAAALRSAQLSVSKDPRWHAPFFWAAFVLQGEWKSLPAGSARSDRPSAGAR